MTGLEFIKKWNKDKGWWAESSDRVYWASAFNMEMPELLQMSIDYLSIPLLRDTSSKHNAISVVEQNLITVECKPEEELDKEYHYLCKSSYGLFVSDLRLLRQPDSSMPSNNELGCFYVCPPSGPCIPIHLLDFIFRINYVHIS